MSSPSLLSRASIVCLLGAGLMTAGCDRKSASPEQAAEQANVASAEVARAPDEVTAAPSATAQAIDRGHKGETGPTLAFVAPDGKPVTLAAFKGKPLLLNLWATWCGPCVAEMPTLDAAAVALKGKVRVIAVSQDLQGKDKVAPFFARRKFAALEPYLDPKLGLSLAYQANLPTTILYDSNGAEVWRSLGGHDWTTPASTALIAEAR